MDYDNILAGLAAASIVGAALASVPFAWIWRSSKGTKVGPTRLHDRYIDVDGCATDESEAAFSNARPRYVLLTASILGASLALAGCLSMVAQSRSLSMDSWGRFFVWLLVLVQMTILFVTPRVTVQYTLAKWTSLTGLIISVAVASGSLQAWRWDMPHSFLVLLAMEFVVGLVISVAGISLPRRPDVYHDGRVVDRCFTVSFFDKWTFAWSLPVIRHASKQQNVELKDLPTTDHALRPSILCSQFEKYQTNVSLWTRIIGLHKKAYIALFAVQLLETVSSFGPDLLLYLLLRLLEGRNDEHGNQALMFIVAIVMGLNIALNDWLDCLQAYIWRQRLEIPIIVQLSAGLFSKSMRAKNLVRVTEADDEEDKEDNKPADESEREDVGIPRTKQSVINLMSIDADRVADFSSAVNSFLDSFLSIVISSVFLIQLIGWIPLASGLLVPILLGPLNLYVTRRYMNAENHLMSARDRKMATVTEAMQGIRQIKFSALEGSWYRKISQVRKRELAWQWRTYIIDMWLVAIWQLGPIIFSATSLTVYAIMNGGISASVAFTSIAVFESLESGLSKVPVLTSMLMDALVSARRIGDYLKSPEQEQNKKTGDKIVLSNVTMAWPSDRVSESDFKLSEVNLSFEMGALNVISGKTGSGKSLLLHGIIGEADIVSGEVILPAPLPRPGYERPDPSSDGWILPDFMAYVAQTPWIENATFKDNILFHHPYDESRYKQTIYACDLETDLKLLVDGDETEIGANGVNLSGGQKWRVSLARALYSRAGILVMDDIFSAVDAHVSRHLYEHALTGPLSHGRTRILVTHHVELCLPSTRYSILLDKGRLVYAKPTQGLGLDGTVSNLLEIGPDVLEDSKSADSVSTTKGRRMSTRSDKATPLARADSHVSSKLKPHEVYISDEKRESGGVKFAIYRGYIRACRGYWFWGLLVAIFIATAAIELGRSYWITLWTRASSIKPNETSRLSPEKEGSLGSTQYSYAATYVGISLLEGAMGIIKYFIMYYGSIHGSKILFEAMTKRILQTPLRFLDTTPVGRLTNRFSSDFSHIDSQIAEGLVFMIENVISIVGIIAAAMFVSPYMLGFLVILSLGTWHVAPLYVRASREVNRLESITHSPIFEQYGSALTGLATLRAFGVVNVYLARMQRLINDNVVAAVHLSHFTRWVDLRLNLIGAAFTLVTALVIAGVSGIDASLAGFALSFSLQLSEGINCLTKTYTDIELNFNAVERVLEYTTLDTEPQEGEEPPAAWPSKGELDIEDLSVSYAKGTRAVLRGLSFSIKQHERVGVVGRTGAGKSSLTLALLRFVEQLSGSIVIDGVDIASIKLATLRSRLTMIPQNPVLFSGTIRTNLDPEQQHSDDELLDALSRVRFMSTMNTITTTKTQDSSAEQLASNISSALSTVVAEGGANFSQGQKQLLCLARAIVARPKILILDEATSAVDMETDALIQATLRQEFQNSTLLVIAHRLTTIADFDRILVLGQGRMVEYDTPRELMGSPAAGGFRELVMESGERKIVEDIIKSHDAQGS